MPLTTVQTHFIYGADWMHPVTDKYCTSDLSSCTVVFGKAIVTTNSSTQPGCVSQGTCIAVPSNCATVIDTYYDGSSTNKSAFNIIWWYHIGASFGGYPLFAISLDGGGVDTFVTHSTPASIYALNLLGNLNIYIPLASLWIPYWKPYQYGTEYVVVAQYSGGFMKAQLTHCVGSNQWVIGVIGYLMSAESSPRAIIPLDYSNDYVPYRELRKAFAYSYDGKSQFGWNAHDIISALKDIYPNRSWAVFDDNEQILYLYNLTPDYVPDWLIQELTPIAMKVIQSPADVAVAKAWLDLLNERNAQIPPQAELP